jgi:hypothetical protein
VSYYKVSFRSLLPVFNDLFSFVSDQVGAVTNLNPLWNEDDCYLGAESFCCSGSDTSSSNEERGLTFADQNAA